MNFTAAVARNDRWALVGPDGEKSEHSRSSGPLLALSGHAEAAGQSPLSGGIADITTEGHQVRL